MSETQNVYGVNESNAILLLEAAQKLDLDPGVVATTSAGHFVVPTEVAKEAGFDEDGRPARKSAKDAADTEAQKEADAQAAREADAKAAQEAQEAAAAAAQPKPAAKKATAKKAATAKSGS